MTADNPGAATTATPLAVVMKGYPRLSETFIAQELLSLQRRGLHFTIYALRRPGESKVHPVHTAITAAVRYLPEYLYQAPREVFRAWCSLRKRADLRASYRRALRVWLADLRRDPTPNRVRRWGQALILAMQLPPETMHIYVHFLHTPASVARYAALIRGLTWSASAHAKDIYTTPAWEKAEKIADSTWVVTCTAANAAHLKDLSSVHEGKVSLVYHGLDLQRFSRFNRPPDLRDGAADHGPVRILSVGRAVEKKGYDVLLEALARLPPRLSWRLVHIGGGELRPKLEEQANLLGLAERIKWMGSRTQEEVLAAYRDADLFVLASKIADNGDRDGLPNVLMEAQSQGLCCVSTYVSGVPELITNGATGLLVGPGDAHGLARALEQAISDPELRQRLGQAGAARVRTVFNHEAAIDALADRLRERIAHRAPVAAA